MVLISRLVILERTDFDDAKEIMDSLSKEDKENSGMNHEYTDSNRIKFRYIERRDGKPVAFIDLYPFNNSDSVVYLLLAVKKEYRKQGFTKILLSKAIEWCKKNKIKKIKWYCEKSNEASYKSALANGFKLTSESKYQYRLELVIK